MRSKACFYANVEDPGLGTPPQAPRRRREPPDQADQSSDLLICTELPRIAEFEAGAIAASPSPLMQDQHAVAERPGEFREPRPREHIQVDSDEMSALRLDPLNPPTFLYSLELAHAVFALPLVRPTLEISCGRHLHACQRADRQLHLLDRWLGSA
jgi:hypothetical protein